MELATLARPYAIAAFKAAKESNKLSAWSGMLSILSSASQHERVSMLLESPDLPAEVKAHRLAEVCGDELDSSAKLFLRRLLSIIGYPFCLKCLRSSKSLKRKRKKA